MRASFEGWSSKRLGRSGSDGGKDSKEVIDHEQAAAAATSSKVVRAQSSSEESVRVKGGSTNEGKMTAAKQSKPRKRRQSKKRDAFSGGNKRRKNATVPAYKADGTDPFNASRTSVEFVVRGKPRPQYRDKPGWNFTRYNPSKTLQTQFCCIAVEQCLNHAGSVPNFGADARIKIEIHFRFPSPKTGQIKNTADIDNLCKFILDACNETFYGDDGQVVCLYADKEYDDEYGGEGYTKVKIQVNERQWKAVS
jgi:Holliday junction resolvase RusA-like endonuclease